MDTRTQSVCELVIKNRANLKNEMLWDMSSNSCAILAAMIGAANGKEITAEQYRSCKAILKSNAGVFSEFRGIARPMVIAKMALQPDPESYLLGSLEIYRKLRSLHKLTASAFMVMAAMTLYEHGGALRADENIERLEELYHSLKKQHPFLISDYDRGYLAMLIASGCSIDRTIDEIESCYNECASIALDKDAVHSLAQIMALSNKSSAVKAGDVQAVVDGLKKAGRPVSKAYGLPAVGALELLDLSAGEKISRISEVDDYLKDKKGFRWYNDSRRIRRLYACLITLIAGSENEMGSLAADISSTVTMTIIETLITTMILVAAASSSSAAASSGSGS